MDAAIQELNARLKAAKRRCSITQRGGKLSLVATLPERDDPTRRRQQRIALGLDATPAGLEDAERKAIDLAHQLRTETFSWSAWEAATTPDLITPEAFRDAARRLHATKYRLDPERGAVAWSKKWSPALNKLPLSGGINVPVLLRVIRAMPEGTASRRDQGNILTQVAKSLGMDPDPLLAASRGYGTASLTERDIPTDHEIESAWSRIRLPHWRWTWGMCAAFGLRPHECASLEWLDGPWIKIADRTKTGSRTVTPCPSSWIDNLELRTLPRPPQPATTITKAFLDALTRDRIGIKPYALRHAYAIRLLVKGVPSELGAKLMGHSLQVHESTYQRWLAANRIREAMANLNL